MQMMDTKDRTLVADEMACPYCEVGMGQFTHFDKHHNDIDDVEMGFSEIYFTPCYECDNCKTRWTDAF